MKKNVLLPLILLSFVFGSCSNTNKSTYYVDFETGEGATAVETQRVKEGDKVSKPNDPYKTHYVFSCWKEENQDQPFDFEHTEIKHNTHLIANWDDISDYSLFHFKSVGCSIEDQSEFTDKIYLDEEKIYDIKAAFGYELPKTLDLGDSDISYTRYSNEAGIIKIHNSHSQKETFDVNIDATLKSKIVVYLETKNCTIDGSSMIFKYIPTDTKDIKFHIDVNSGCSLPEKLKPLFELDLPKWATYDKEHHIIRIENEEWEEGKDYILAASIEATKDEVTYQRSFNCSNSTAHFKDDPEFKERDIKEFKKGTQTELVIECNSKDYVLNKDDIDLYNDGKLIPSSDFELTYSKDGDLYTFIYKNDGKLSINIHPSLNPKVERIITISGDLTKITNITSSGIPLDFRSGTIKFEVPAKYQRRLLFTFQTNAVVKNMTVKETATSAIVDSIFGLIDGGADLFTYVTTDITIEVSFND